MHIHDHETYSRNLVHSSSTLRVMAETEGAGEEGEKINSKNLKLKAHRVVEQKRIKINKRLDWLIFI